MKRLLWVAVYALACLLELLAAWAKKHAERRIKDPAARSSRP